MSDARVAFLFGSGASIGAGAPSTTHITNAVLNGEGYARHSDSTYSKGPVLYGAAVDSHVPHLASFLSWLADYLSPYYDEALGRMPTYEDLYYVIDQIHTEETGDLENVLVLEGQREIRPRLNECASQITSGAGSRTRAPDATQEVLNYITGVVVTELDRSYRGAGYLGFIDEALSARPVSQLPIFTLNHEHILEDYLTSRAIPMIDGFGPPDNMVRYWDPRLLASSDRGCLVLKLHGSIRWWRFRPDGGDWHDERIGLPLTGDVQHMRGPNGGRQHAIDFHPLALIGTFNKIPDYTSAVFSELFTQLRLRLNDVEALVVCGYGFGDRGINSQVIEWLYAARDRRIVVVHPEPDHLRKAARRAVANKWDDWIEKGLLRLYASPAEQVIWSRLVARINR